MTEERIVIIGSTGFLGSYLLSELNFRNVIGTQSNENSFYYYMLGDDVPDSIQKFKPTVVILCAGISNIERCENDIDCYFTNVIETIKTLSNFGSIGCRIIFLSSSSVFSGATQVINEKFHKSPTCEYARQKIIVEDFLKKYWPEQTTIIRPTKIVDNHKLVEAIFSKKLKTIEVFHNLKISPISRRFIKNFIEDIIINRMTGVYHVSSNVEVSYYDFGVRLLTRLGARDIKLIPVPINKPILFNPTYPSLGTMYSGAIFSIQDVSDAINDIIKGQTE